MECQKFKLSRTDKTLIKTNQLWLVFIPNIQPE